MFTLRLPSLVCLATLTLLLSPAFAQDNNTDSENSNSTNLNLCPLHINRDFNPNAPINSSGSVNIHWNALMMDPPQNDWIFTLTYNETRNRQQPYVKFDTMHWLQSYISAPNASEAQTCIHMFGGLNATSSSSQQNGCDGVLDDACTSLLRNITFDNGCSLSAQGSEWRDQARQACGDDTLSRILSTTKAQDFSNKTCSIDHPPGSTSADGYRTFAALGEGIVSGNVDSNASDFTWYDLYVRQTIPFVVSAQFSGGISETQVLCVVPKEIAKGGRVPAQRSAASPAWRSSSWMTVVVAMMACLAVAVG